jgi:hypothetical protein
MNFSVQPNDRLGSIAPDFSSVTTATPQRPSCNPWVTRAQEFSNEVGFKPALSRPKRDSFICTSGDSIGVCSSPSTTEEGQVPQGPTTQGSTPTGGSRGGGVIDSLGKGNVP